MGRSLLRRCPGAWSGHHSSIFSRGSGRVRDPCAAVRRDCDWSQPSLDAALGARNGTQVRDNAVTSSSTRASQNVGVLCLPRITDYALWRKESFQLSDEAAIQGISDALIANIVTDAKREFGEALVCVVAGGSRVRGTARSDSDFDVHFVHTGAWHQKRFVGGSNNEARVDIDITINPLGIVVDWINRFPGFADFYADALILYPETSDSETEQIIEAARRARSEPRITHFESEEHYVRYRQLSVTLSRSKHAASADQKLAVATIIAGLAELRLFLAGEPHIRSDRLLSQVKLLDPGLADALHESLCDADPEKVHTRLGAALAALRPSKDFFAKQRVRLFGSGRGHPL